MLRIRYNAVRVLYTAHNKWNEAKKKAKAYLYNVNSIETTIAAQFHSEM